MSWFVLVGYLAVCLTALVIAHGSELTFLPTLSPEAGASGLIWQVQTTFLSVGLAGLAIATQLFVDTPHAVGATRADVLRYAYVEEFVGLGLAANALLAVETIWLQSDAGVAVAVVGGLALTVAMMLISYIRVARLFGKPSLLDEVVKRSLARNLIDRLDTVARNYASATKQLEPLFEAGLTREPTVSASDYAPIRTPRGGLVLRRINPRPVRQALAALAPRVQSIPEAAAAMETSNYSPPEIVVSAEPGDRVRHGAVVFRVRGYSDVPAPVRERVETLLASSLEFEGREAVTPDEEISREISMLQDAVAAGIRAGAFGSASRALELIDAILREAWTAHIATQEAPRRTYSVRRRWLYGVLAEVELDAIQSPKAFTLFVHQAMARVLQVRDVKSTDYTDESLRSFTRIWSNALVAGNHQLDEYVDLILLDLQNLAEYSHLGEADGVDLRVRSSWAIVELVKLAVDARRFSAARAAANYLSGLFEYTDTNGHLRKHARAGQLVLSAWLAWQESRSDEILPRDEDLHRLLGPKGNRSDIVAAGLVVSNESTPFSRWQWWEAANLGPMQVKALEMNNYVLHAVARALIRSNGTLPKATSHDLNSFYTRLMPLLEEVDEALDHSATTLRANLSQEIERWKASEITALANAHVSDQKVGELKRAFEARLYSDSRISRRLPRSSSVPLDADAAMPVFGINYKIPRHYFVDEIFNSTYADPKDLGDMIAQAFIDAENRKIVDHLAALTTRRAKVRTDAVVRAIAKLGDDASKYILLAPFGGPDAEEWWEESLQASLKMVSVIETAALDDTLILFDPRRTLLSHIHPRTSGELEPVGETGIALGVIDDVNDQDDPKVRVEAGEYVVFWPGDDPFVHAFQSS
ncbi:hypothetical protein E1212_16250 [Jiangella ureilytica]|uniref:DUF2254 domain-containing protein n=1 Tax=Jiangella ureilytica TaxID=2530374 RepID=A0A4R4RK91_9ACTN|nr:hypothetical protein [Jiangella ureilytica]TDC49977.1 hypothetical protein E1212_16250 [Jiangella ureilytica]